jgi:hypothetical protein
MTNTLDELLAMPALDLGPLPILDDLSLGWVSSSIDSTPVADVPAADTISLDDLADRYRPIGDLVTPRRRGRKPPRWNDPRSAEGFGGDPTVGGGGVAGTNVTRL